MSKRAITKSGLSLAKRTARSMALRAEGFTLEDIAAQLGINKATVWKDCMRALYTWQRLYAEFYQEHTYTTHLRCERLIRENMARAMQGDGASGRIVLAAMDRQAKLFGLDAKVTKTSGDAGDNPYDGITEAERDRELVELFRSALERRNAAIVNGEIVENETPEWPT